MTLYTRTRDTLLALRKQLMEFRLQPITDDSDPELQEIEERELVLQEVYIGDRPIDDLKKPCAIILLPSLSMTATRISRRHDVVLPVTIRIYVTGAPKENLLIFQLRIMSDIYDNWTSSNTKLKINDTVQLTFLGEASFAPITIDGLTWIDLPAELHLHVVS